MENDSTQDEGKSLNGSAYDSVGGGFHILIMLIYIYFDPWADLV